MEKISVVIITLNEERNIKRCLDSIISVADEIIVVDSMSTDKTEQICSTYNVRFVKHAFEGYIEQKNFALSLAKNKLVLSLDADEALSDELKNSITEVKNNLSASGYTMNRLTNYCGHWVKHCGWYPDRKLRLFIANLGSWGGINPHDKFIFHKKESVVHLKGDLLHYSYYTIDEHYKQSEKFSNIAAQSYFENNKKATWIKLWINPAVKFLRDYFFKFGFLDGSTGFKICYISASATHDKYKKLKNIYKSKKDNLAIK